MGETELRRLLYCDFANPKADTRNYIEVTDLNSLRNIVEGYLNEFNNMSKKPMNLVLFRYLFFYIELVFISSFTWAELSSLYCSIWSWTLSLIDCKLYCTSDKETHRWERFYNGYTCRQAWCSNTGSRLSHGGTKYILTPCHSRFTTYLKFRNK